MATSSDLAPEPTHATGVAKKKKNKKKKKKKGKLEPTQIPIHWWMDKQNVYI